MASYTQNTLTASLPPRTPKEHFSELSKERKRLCIMKGCKYLNIGSHAFYKILRGQTPLSGEAILFFSRYFDVDPESLIDPSRIEELRLTTRVKEDPAEYKKSSPKMNVIK